MPQTTSQLRKNRDPNEPSAAFAKAKAQAYRGDFNYPPGIVIPGNSDSGPYMEILCFNYKRAFTDLTKDTAKFVVRLPFPLQGITFGSVMQYNNFNALFGRGLNSTNSDFKSAMKGLGQGALSQAGKKFTDAGASLISDTINRIGGEVTQDQIKNQASSFFGLTMNPRQELAFNGVTLRSYSFNYIFLPRNQTESLILQTIIQKLEEAHYPTYEDAAKVFLKYPDEFVMGFYTPDARRMRGVPLIPDCFMSQFSYTYNPMTGSRVFPDGTPTSYMISFTMSEANQLTREEVQALRAGSLPANT